MYIEAKKAIAIHMAWRSTFSLAIALEEELCVEQRDTIRYPTHCAIGRWIQSLESSSFRSHSRLVELNAKHRRFHLEMERVAELIEQGSYITAQRAIGEGSGFSQASKELAQAITNFDEAFRQSLTPQAGPAESAYREPRFQ